MANIHPTAIVEAGAKIAADVEIGPYSIIGSQVSIGAGTCVMGHVVLAGATSIGSQCRIFPFASIGQQTQDLKYKGGTPRVEIGDRNTIREFVTVNAATNDGDATRIGSDCHIMAYAHIAHDCVVGDGVIMANCATLAGHVIVEDRATIGGLSGVHQFVRIGAMSFIGGCSKVTQDVPPYMIADGNPISIHGLNSVGLKRRGLDERAQTLLKAAFKLLYRESLTTRQAVERIESEVEKVPEVVYLTDFVKSSTRGIVR